MNQFEQLAQVARLVKTVRGDTLWAVAARELGDAQRWHELIWLNHLTPPYLTDDPNAASATVLLTGTPLRLPGPATLPTTAVDDAAVFGTDLDLTGGLLHAVDGDLGLVAGVPNLVQALRHVLNTDIGELRFHPTYGCGVHRLLGARATPDTLQLAQTLVYRAVQADARIARVVSATTDISGDILNVDLSAMAISGEVIHVSN